MPVISYQGLQPEVHSDVFIAPSAWIIGKVTIAERVSIFFGATLRGDIQRIVVAAGTNIQENVVLHTSRGLQDCVVGPEVTIGHGAIIHGAALAGHSIIGMQATILDGANVGQYCIIGANSLVTMNTKIPDGHLAFGNPAKVVRELTEVERKEIDRSAEHYYELGRNYRSVI